MAKTETVKALWVAGYEAALPDGTVLVPNETTVEIPAGEAEQSENWSVTAPAPSKKAPSVFEDGDE